jgi:hypothetical protein
MEMGVTAMPRLIPAPKPGYFENLENIGCQIGHTNKKYF